MNLMLDIAKDWLSLSILNKFWSGWLIENSRHPPPPRKFWNLESCKSHFQHFQEVFPGAHPGFHEVGLDKRPPTAVAPRGSRGMFPRKIFNFRTSELRFPALPGETWSGLAELVHFFLTTRLLCVFTFSLGGSTEPPEPPLDPPGPDFPPEWQSQLRVKNFYEVYICSKRFLRLLRVTGA